MTSLPSLDGHDPGSLWQRFCALLWHDASLGFWLDASRMGLDQSQVEGLAGPMAGAFAAMARLEEGAIANADEGRQVGHYWLRNPQLAPDAAAGARIAAEVDQLEAFGEQLG